MSVQVPAAASPARKPADPVADGSLPLAELMSMANGLQQAGRLGEAEALYAQWLAATDSPLRHVAEFNRGTVLSLMDRDAEAVLCYQRAIARLPSFAQARLNLGNLFERGGDPEAALAQWRAVVDDPAVTLEFRVMAHNNLGRLQETLRRYPEAEASLKASLALKPRQFDVIQHHVHLRQKQCAWPICEALDEVTPNMQLMGTSLLSMMGATDDPALQLLAAHRFATERVAKPPAEPLHASGPRRSGRVRIGYLSGDLHMHAVGLLTPELLELHDRSRFEVYGFCWTPESNHPQRRRLLAALDQHVRLTGVDDATAARLICEAGIDVLVDLQGLTSGARPGILVRRPAPVQVSYLGLPGTSAIPGVDWILADRFVMPPELLPYCTERPLYLPHSFQVSDRQRLVGETPTRAANGLPEDAFVYCSFNNNHKFTPEVFRCWMRVLRQVPGSVLWLLADNDTSRANLLREAAQMDVAPERLVFAGRVAPPDYLARFQLADLMLDTFPFNAGTTASDALWMGLPILTLAGRSYISRMAGSLLHAVGLPELVTETLADYEALAVRLGRQPQRAASLKRYLAEHGRGSPLFDLPQIVRDIEGEFERLALAQRDTQAAAAP